MDTGMASHSRIMVMLRQRRREVIEHATDLLEAYAWEGRHYPAKLPMWLTSKEENPRPPLAAVGWGRWQRVVK